MAREEFDVFASGAVIRLYRTAYLMVGDHHLAEDLAQDVLARVYVAWPKIHGDPYGYAYRAIAHAASNRRRWRGRHPESPWPDGSGGGETDGPDEAVVARDEVMGALRSLPARQRVIVVLRYYADLTEAQTAAALDISVGTVKSQHARALARLRGVLGEELSEAPDPTAPGSPERVALPLPTPLPDRRTR
jgi:RNA polymerase sigma-70 factor (sigma-E family)